MPRKRAGTLVERTTGYFAQVTVNGPTGKPERRFLNLQTKDRALAERKLAKIVRLIDEGQVVAVAKDEAVTEETFADYAASWITSRDRAKVVMAEGERQHLEDYALPILASKSLGAIRPGDIRDVLERAKLAGRSKETIRKVRGTLNRLFTKAWRDELISENPVARTEVPDDAPEDKRPRTILTDAEITEYLLRGKNGEVKAAAICARVLGGMRTAEILRWTWDMVDLANFHHVTIHRAKQVRGTTGVTQDLEVPAPMRPALREWWASQGSPKDGPVFPVRTGFRKGAQKNAHNSFAFRLRRDLHAARIFRHECIGGAHVCTDSSCCLNMGKDPIYADTVSAKRVDFHSFRRAFASALAEAGTNEQVAMRLTAHTDSRVHMRYVGQTERMKRIPEGAVPTFHTPVLQLAVANDSEAPAAKATGTDDCSPIPDSCKVHPERFELSTFGFEGRRSIQLS